MTDTALPQIPPQVSDETNWPIDSVLRIPVRFLPPALLPAAQRFAVVISVAHAIIDDPELTAGERTALLDGMAARISGQPAGALDEGLSRLVDDFVAAALPCDADAHHAVHALQACRQDAVKTRYRDWNELLLYCRYAAAPIGRFCLEAMKEDAAAQAATEALCCALALLVILRECRHDYRDRDRVYLPERWFREAKLTYEALGAARMDARLNQVLAQGLANVERLLTTAQPLPRLLRSRHGRAASAAALLLARKLARRLQTSLAEGDPPTDTVALTRGDYRAALWHGRWRKFWR